MALSPKKKKLLIPGVKGMHDILPGDQDFWQRVRTEVENLAGYYGFNRIDTPLVERAETFERSIGQTTDIVEKQMYFIKGARDRLVLRPEGTAPVMRAYLEHGLDHIAQPLKLYYWGSMFRHEQPQEGRFRQFHQAGFEIIGGESDPIYDTQIILICYRLLEALKLTNLEIRVNTIGCQTCRSGYSRRLTDYCKKQSNVCRDCRRRLLVNPLRFLDCKDEKCEVIKKEAPLILDNLCPVCKSHFKLVLEYLDELELPYSLNNCLVRGLDYYNRTVFEIFVNNGNQSLLGGGRYDYLAGMLGGRETPAVGAAIGIERLIAAIKLEKIEFPTRPKASVFLVHIGDLAKKKSLALIEKLKRAGIKAEEALGKESLKAQLRQADKEKASLALIFGQKEALEETIIVRELATGAQETVPLDRIVEKVKKFLK